MLVRFSKANRDALVELDLATGTYRTLFQAAPSGQLSSADVSPDGAHISYLATDPTLTHNDLYVANADGSSPVAISRPNGGLPVDAHFFSPDSQAVIYSMVNPATSSAGPTWWEALLGIQVASAHDEPSEWYRTPIAGGPAQRITTLNDTGFNRRTSPDGQYVAFFSSSGLFVMALDGKDITQLSKEIFAGNLNWVKWQFNRGDAEGTEKTI